VSAFKGARKILAAQAISHIFALLCVVDLNFCSVITSSVTPVTKIQIA